MSQQTSPENVWTVTRFTLPMIGTPCEFPQRKHFWKILNRSRMGTHTSRDFFGQHTLCHWHHVIHVSAIIDEEVHQIWRHYQPQKRSTPQNMFEPSSSRVTQGALSKYLSASWGRCKIRCMHTCKCKHICCIHLPYGHLIF